ncbi:MAG: alpha-amylase family glycosyl hydrolase [Chthoniobacterales bacterium]
MNLIRSFFLVPLAFFGVVSTSPALPDDPSLSLDATYGLFPRPEGFSYTASPEDWRDINIYQIFTDRFADGDQANNTSQAMGINRSSWFVNNSGRSFPQNRNFHHGGDWKGLQDNLDYLDGMGVRAVWISGVQMNAQGRDGRYTPYHQYHPTDFFNVDPAQGTFQELKDLIDACHTRGIYVILDVVINHTADLNGLWGNNKEEDKGYWANGNGSFAWWDEGRKHPYPFNELTHFHNNGTINNWDSWPEYLYGQFKGTDDLKTESPHVSYWITEAFRNLIEATDCDGFRVDAIKHVEYNWVKQWADDIRKHAASLGKNDFILFGEYFTYDNNTLASHCREEDYSFNSALFFPMSQTFKSVFIDGAGTGQLTSQLNNRFIYGEGTDRLVTFIDNHDVNRISLQNGGDTGDDVWELRPALTFLYTATPVPCLYYGTEHAFDQGGHYNGQDAWQLYEGQAHDDADWQRETMFDRGFQPGPAQGNKLAATDAPLYQHIKKLNEARAAHRSLTRGSFQQRWDSSGKGPYAYSRVYAEEESLVALNTADGPVSLQPAVGKPEGTTFVNALNPADTLNVSGGTLNIQLSGKESKIYVAGNSQQPSEAAWTLGAAGEATQLSVTYRANDGPLSAAVAINVLISVDGGAVQRLAMVNSGGVWSYTYELPPGATLATLVFEDAADSAVTDSAGAWTGFNVVYTPPVFSIDGLLDSENYLVADNGMRIWAARRGSKLYLATWSSQGGSNDHFLLLSDNFGNPAAHPWGKAGLSNFYFDGWPWLAGEGGDSYHALNNGGVSGRVAMGTGGQVLEAEIDLNEVFGRIPEVIYVAALAYGDNEGEGITSSCPPRWDNGNDVAITDLLPISTDAIEDSDTDGYFDGGRPEMRTLVNGNERDANYDLRRFYLDELIKESAEITVKFRPVIDPADVISNVEVFTNLNRRDFAVLEEDRATVSTASNTYFRAYAMSGPDADGYYTATLPVNRCGAYRLQVRYRVNGLYRYYTDNAQRRDCAVVVSPKKALRTNMYEVNPLIVEARDSSEYGRSTFVDLVTTGGHTDDYDNAWPDALNEDHYREMGITMLWLQPIHPIGVEGRDTNPSTGTYFEPGSPYAVRDYWSVAPLLGRANTAGSALAEFQTFVSSLDGWGVDVMMDGTFNHSAPDAIMGQGAVDLGITADASARISEVRVGWYSKEGDFSNPATSVSEIAVAPDRSDFGKWTDVRDFYFGNYDALVKYASPSHRLEYLLERDDVDLLTSQVRELWEYFAYYPVYWLEKTGHPRGTPKEESYKGIDGLRCDFAQGLPSQFWEYCINKTRSVKWDFLFMAESLDGYREVGEEASSSYRRHGVGYRSARHFDVLNENIVFYWRDTFFGYPANGGAGGGGRFSTGLTFQAYDNRRNAYDNVTLLNNLVSHDEVFPHNDVFSMAYAYAQVAAVDGIPMLMYGQEAGAQNSAEGYAGSVANFGSINPVRNFANYESNFGKNIPNFKVFNEMTSIWDSSNRDWALQGFYGRVNKARRASPALQSRNQYFLSRLGGGGGFVDEMFAVAKVQQPGASASGQEVVLVFVSNNYRAYGPGTGPAATFDLGGSVATWLGIEDDKNYNIKDLLADDPAAAIWSTPRSGADLKANGLYVGLPYEGRHAHYLRLVDVDSDYTDTNGNGTPDALDPDIDGDGMTNEYELAHGLNPNSAADRDRDDDADGFSNYVEFMAGTAANNRDSALKVVSFAPGQTEMAIRWKSVPGAVYRVRYTYDLAGRWSDVDGGLIAADTQETEVTMSTPEGATKAFYSVVLVP